MLDDKRVGDCVRVNVGTDQNPDYHSGVITGVAYDYLVKGYIVTPDTPIIPQGYSKRWQTIVAIEHPNTVSESCPTYSMLVSNF